MAQGDTARFEADAPAGLEIVSAGVPSMTVYSVNDGRGYGGGFYWSGGGAEVTGGQSAALLGGFSSPYFGFQLICGTNPCHEYPSAAIYVNQIVLGVHETVNPTLSAPDGLWQARTWVRGDWPLNFGADSPSGVCGLAATLNRQPIPGSLSARDVTTWHQCAAPRVSESIELDKYGQGPLLLVLSAADAAQNTASVSKTVYVDNEQPTVALTGPSDAPSTAGTQYVTATASAGPSGVAGIGCSVDGTPSHWYPSSVAQVPVSGVGEHQVTCTSENNAVDGNGVHGVSAPELFSIKIGEPTVIGIAFSKLVDSLRCQRVLRRKRVPAQSVAIRRHGTVVHVDRAAHTESVRGARCHVRSARRHVTVWVTVRRHGRKLRVRRRRTIRVLLKPHVVQQTERFVGHGRATTVDGWLGTTGGIALGGQVVDVLTAADNGDGDFTLASVALTSPDGGWSARLPAGPSRLVEATYSGAPTEQASQSSVVRLVVPAKVQLLSVAPRQVAWGGTVRLTGQLQGGYLPPGGALVRLRIGLGSAVTTYGVHEHVDGNGRFSTIYTFGAGDPSVYRTFWFEIASLPMGDYPYAPADSRRLSVLVGGHPPRPPRRHT